MSTVTRADVEADVIRAIEADVIRAIEANGTDVARRDEFDVEAIVDALWLTAPTRNAAGELDYDGMPEAEFWGLIQLYQLPVDA